MEARSHIPVTEAKEMCLRSLGLLRNRNTFRTYRNALDIFRSVLPSQQTNPSNIAVASLTEERVADFVAYTEKFSSATQSLYLQVIKGFFEYLNVESLSTVKPARVQMLIRQRIRRTGSKTSAYAEDDIRYLIETVSNPHTLYTSTVDNEAESFGLRQEYLGLKQASDLESGQSLSSLPLFARHDKGAGKKIKAITPTTIRNLIAERVEQVLGDEATGRVTPNTFLHYFVTNWIKDITKSLRKENHNDRIRSICRTD